MQSDDASTRPDVLRGMSDNRGLQAQRSTEGPKLSNFLSVALVCYACMRTFTAVPSSRAAVAVVERVGSRRTHIIGRDIEVITLLLEMPETEAAQCEAVDE